MPLPGPSFFGSSNWPTESAFRNQMAWVEIQDFKALTLMLDSEQNASDF